MDQLSNDCDLEEHASSPETENGLFDFEIFCNNMKKCISENVSDDSDVELGYYLQAYEQLYNFFILLGGAFQFVAIDVKSKIKILQDKRDEEKNKSLNNFSTVKTMITYEKESNYFLNSKHVSGSRTLLRLHRGLDFIRKFLKEIYQLENNIKLGGIAREVYDQTLAEYHTWVVRNSSRVAMKFLPSRGDLLNKISQKNEEKLNNMLLMFPEALETMTIAYDRVQKLYSDNKILDLP